MAIENDKNTLLILMELFRYIYIDIKWHQYYFFGETFSFSDPKNEM